MTKYVDKYENAITVIENDITDMIIHNKYIDLPQYSDTKDQSKTDNDTIIWNHKLQTKKN